MDSIQEFIHTHVPPTVLSTLSTHTSTYYRILSTILTIRSTISRTLNPLLTKLLHSPDIPTVLLVLLILFVSFKILDIVYRSIIFWVRLGIRLLFWGSIAIVGLWIWNKGLAGAAEDLSWIATEWKSEYKGWQRREDMARMQRQAGLGERGRWG